MNMAITFAVWKCFAGSLPSQFIATPKPPRPFVASGWANIKTGECFAPAPSTVIEQLLPGKIERVVLGHLSRDCNPPELAAGAVRTQLQRNGRADLEIFCALQNAISPRFHVGETSRGDFQPTFDSALFG